MAEKTLKINVEVGTTSIDALETKLSKLQSDIKGKGIGTEEFRELSTQIQAVTSSLEAANNKVAGFTAEKKIMAMDGAIKTLSGTVSGVVGIFGLLGVESDKLGEFEKKAASAIAFGMGLKDVSEGFQQIAKSEALAAIGAKLFGNTLKTALVATGIGALVVGLGLLIAYWDDIKEAVTGANAITETYDSTVKEVTTAVTNFQKSLFEVNAAFTAAKAGTMSKQEALKKYNDTLGKTVGYAGSLEQAESLMASNTSVVIESIKLRAQAQVFYAKSAEASAKAVSGEAFDLSWFDQGLNILKSGGNMMTLAVANAETMGKNYAEIGKQTKAFADEGDKLTLAAIENDKKLKAGLAKPPEIKTTEAKKVETPEERAARVKKEAQDRINANEAIKQSEDELAQAQIQKSKDIVAQLGVEDAAKEVNYQRERQRLVDLLALEKVGSNEYKTIQAELNTLDAGRATQKQEFNDQVAVANEEARLKAEEQRQKDVENVLTQRDIDIAIEEEKLVLEEQKFQEKTALAVERNTLERDAALANTELTEAQRTGIVELYSQREQNIKKQAEKDEKERKQILEQQKLAIVADGLGAIASILGEGSKVGKAFAVSQALMNTYLGVTQVLANKTVIPEPFGTIQKVVSIAGVLATGFKAVKQITATPPLAASAGGASMTAPSVPAGMSAGSASLPAQTPKVPEINPFQTIRAYVLAGDVRSGQEADKRIELRRTV